MVFGFRTSILLGILTFIFLVATIISGFLMKKGKISFKVHRLLAFLTLILAAIHAGVIIFR